MILSLRSKLREAIFGAPKSPTIEEGKAVISRMAQTIGVRPSTSFANQVTVFNEDPVVKESILQSAYQINSTGFFVTADESYAARLPVGPKKENWSAKEAIIYWNKQNNMDEKISQVTIEDIAFGNSFWNITQSGFVNIPIESVQDAVAADQTIPVREKYKLRLTATYGSKIIEHGEFLHFPTAPIGNGPMGAGIIQGLISTPASITTADGTTVTVPSLYEIRKAIRASMKEGFTKFSFGNELWVFEGYPTGTPAEGVTAATGLYALGDSLRDMPSTGQRITTNVKGDIKLALPQRTQSYDRWIEQIDHEFYMALGNPSLKLGLEQGFTKSTAEAAKELYEMKLAAIKRVIKRLIEGLWVQVLNKMGFDGEAANVRLNFGTQEIEYATPDVFAAVDKQIISTDEARHILQKNMKWDITEKAPAMPEPITTTDTLALGTAENKIAALKLENEASRKLLHERLLAT